jgi:transcription termination factor Rho
VTDTTELTAASGGAPDAPRRAGALSTMRLAELQGLAGSLGISGTSKMRKSDLMTAIRAKQSGGSASASVARASAPAAEKPRADQQETERPARRSRRAQSGGSAPQADTSQTSRPDHSSGTDERADRRDEQSRGEQRDRDSRGEQRDGNRDGGRDHQRPEGRRERDQSGEDNRGDNRGQRDRSDSRDDNRGQRDHDDSRGQNDHDNNRGGRNNQGNQNNQNNQNRRDDDERGGGRRRNRQRSRDRKRRGGRDNDYRGGDVDTTVHEDDVLVPVAGILDVLDNYAFLRTSGYLPGENDVYVPMGMVKKNGLRKGDAITGSVRALREGEQIPARQKFNALVQLDTVNGMTTDQAKERVDFGKLTPLYPQERLRLETEPGIVTTRLIDLIAPIGKGQRGLIVSPAKAGKTLILQAIANAITVNNPEAHLMVVLIDERPEEVTDMQRAVKGEVIASTFDRPADDHTTVAELAIERAKRLVEMGHDVVVLLDSITRLGRAYNLAAPASGRILSGGVDSSALYPPKRFFGAARNIEDGGSLTILATALVDTGSKMDEVIFEEFKGTGNMELRLSRQLAERRIYPAIDVNPSGTRREEILMSAEELKIHWKLRRVLSALDSQQGIELLIDRIKKTKSNVEFLMQVQQTSSIHLDDN